MALYRFEAKVISRGAGRSTVAAAAYRSGNSVMAAAAYRAGDRLMNDETGRVHDFSNKRDVAGAEIMLPAGAPAWMRDRQKLWNAVERIETRINSQLARDFIISIPHEMNLEQRRQVIRDFVQQAFVAKGIPADVAWHSPERNGGLNHHAHVMTPFRVATPAGLSKNKLRAPPGAHPAAAWKQELESLRVTWAEVANRHLERAGLDIRIDHRSLAARGIDRIPEPKVGRVATHVIEKDGRASKAGNDRRQASELNARMAEAKQEHARAVVARAEVVDLMTERAKRNLAELDRLMRAQQDEPLHRQQAGYANLKGEPGREQLRQEMAAKAERDAEEVKKGKGQDRTHDGGLNSAEARYSIALGENFDGRDPFGSLSRAAGAEHAAFIRQQEALKHEAFRERDPGKKQIIENRRMIESADFMAITSERLIGIEAAQAGVRLETIKDPARAEKALQGMQAQGRDSPHLRQAIADNGKAEWWREQAGILREQRGQLIEQQRAREDADRQAQQRAKEQARPAARQEGRLQPAQPSPAAHRDVASYLAGRNATPGPQQDRQAVREQQGPPEVRQGQQRAQGAGTGRQEASQPPSAQKLGAYLGRAPDQRQATAQGRPQPGPAAGRDQPAAARSPAASQQPRRDVGKMLSRSGSEPTDAKEQTDARQAKSWRTAAREQTDAAQEHQPERDTPQRGRGGQGRGGGGGRR